MDSSFIRWCTWRDISGLISFSGIGALESAIISGILGFSGSIGGDLISNNGNFSKINWYKASIMGLTNFILVWGTGVQNSNAIGNEVGKRLIETKNTSVKNVYKVLFDSSISANSDASLLKQHGAKTTKDVLIDRASEMVAVTISSSIASFAFDIGTDYFNLF